MAEVLANASTTLLSTSAKLVDFAETMAVNQSDVSTIDPRIAVDASAFDFLWWVDRRVMVELEFTLFSTAAVRNPGSSYIFDISNMVANAVLVTTSLVSKTSYAVKVLAFFVGVLKASNSGKYRIKVTTKNVQFNKYDSVDDMFYMSLRCRLTSPTSRNTIGQIYDLPQAYQTTKTELVEPDFELVG